MTKLQKIQIVIKELKIYRSYLNILQENNNKAITYEKTGRQKVRKK